MTAAAWEITGLSVRLGAREAVSCVSFVVAPGEVVGVLGPNGSGKTTLLRAGLGLIAAAAGDIRLGGRPLPSLGDGERARLAGYLPQERRATWNLAAREVAALGAPDQPPMTALATADAALDRVGLAGFGDRGVLDMSGGERARVLLARLLATRAPLLVADEPAAGLDPDAQFLTLELLREEAARGAGVVVTLHDLTLAARACDRMVVLKAGRVMADAAPADALNPRILSDVFGLDGALVDTPSGPVVAARRTMGGGS